MGFQRLANAVSFRTVLPSSAARVALRGVRRRGGRCAGRPTGALPEIARFVTRGRVPRVIVSLLFLHALGACGGGGSSSDSAAAYGISGAISHLDTGSLTISDGAEALTVAQGATGFAFTRPLPNGSGYSVTVVTQPTGGNCAVSNGAGVVSGGAIGNVAIVCNSLVSQALALGVNAVGSLSSNGSRIFLPVTMVGTHPVTINAIVDTGSAGTVLNALDVFPSSMVTTNGFVFPSGQTSLTYNGITVTNVGATRMYGEQSADPTEQIGNLGFAQLTFGSGAHATTAVVPILFAYQFKANGAVTAPTNFANLIGINPSLGPITIAGDAASGTLSPCTPQSTSTCGAASPFRSLTYATGVDDGYILAKVTFADCDIGTPGNCPVSPALTLGVTSGTMAGFNTTTLAGCSTVVLTGTTPEPVCSQVIPAVMVTSGSAAFSGPAIFDSGAPTTRLSVPPGSTFPDALAPGSPVTITTSAGFAYQYTTGTGYLTTTVSKPTDPNTYTNSGIGFFAQNSLLVDYSRSLEGWRNGS